MTPARWQQVEHLFESALERAHGERTGFLTAACAGDVSLQKEVESLLAADEQAEGFIDAPVYKVVAEMLASDGAEPVVGRRIGPYQIIREISRGGMGVVYQALRVDDQYRKQVAIKLIKRGVDTEDVLRRFRHERQILANLEHPNIARLLDGGTTEDDLPYFVMEYIEGVPINEYCDTHKLNTTERLKLFRSVCAAVHYAHQNLVVHRDLKPSNILVVAEGIPKLFDFGIAKLLDAELSSQASDLTATGLRLMTPEYASPEQVRGAVVTTASDIYSLGVVLYELLSGHRPYLFKSRLPREIERVICEVEPERPSTAISRVEEITIADGASRVTLTPERVSETREGQPERLRRRLRGDLDNIVLMALRKDAQRRYASVNQLSEEIRRHLEGLPVIARKDTLSYRMEKFNQRNKVAVAIAAVFVLLVVGFGVSMAVQSIRLARERDRAEQVSTFLVDLFDAYDPSDISSEARGRNITVREALDRNAENVTKELKDQPEIQATLLYSIGWAYRDLGFYESAQPLLETALKIRRDKLGDEHPEVARNMMGLALLMRDKGDYQAAEPLAREALAIHRKVLGDEHLQVAQTLDGAAYLMRSKGDYEAAESFIREALAIRRKLLGSEHPQVAVSLHGLAAVLRDKGDYEQAEPLFREALEMLRKLLGHEHPEVARVLNNLALLMQDRGDYDAAQPVAQEALALRRKSFGNEHPEVARSLSNLGNLLRLKGNYKESDLLLREALAVQRKVVGDKHPDTSQTINNLGLLLMDKGDYETAEPHLRESLSMRSELLGGDHLEVARSSSDLAELLYRRGNSSAAESLYRESLNIYRKALPEGHPNIAHPLIGLGNLLISAGEPQEAEPLVREGLAILQKQLVKSYWLVANAESVLGGCLAALGHYREAEPLLVGSYPVIDANRGGRNQRMFEALNRIVALYQAWGKPDKAAEYRAMLPTSITPQASAKP